MHRERLLKVGFNTYQGPLEQQVSLVTHFLSTEKLVRDLLSYGF